MAINKLQADVIEAQKSIVEELNSKELDSIENPILKRCAEKGAGSKDVTPHQAYDRMHHRHNRS